MSAVGLHLPQEAVGHLLSPGEDERSWPSPSPRGSGGGGGGAGGGGPPLSLSPVYSPLHHFSESNLGSSGLSVDLYHASSWSFCISSALRKDVTGSRIP